MKTRKQYILVALITFIACVLIAMFIDNKYFVRGFVGDIIVTMLMYSFVKIFKDFNPKKLAVSILLFSYSVELLQAINIVKLIGLEQYKLARIVVGTTFDFKDILAYTIGVGIIYLWDRKK